jgi:hypothetical protein
LYHNNEVVGRLGELPFGAVRVYAPAQRSFWNCHL